MTIRSRIEEREDLWLCPAGARSRDALRQIDEAPSDLRTAFQRDRDRVIHSKAFRRLKFKTQVFLSPDGDHFRTRLTHTLEVTQIARTISRALNLNEDLTEAIGLAHDLGHTPFGHAGERALARVFPNFRHNEQSLRVVDVLEKDGRGLNLTDLTRDGILRHSKPDNSVSGEIAGTPATAEAQVVKISDSIAYMNHDFDDAVRGGILGSADLPMAVKETLGPSHSSRIDRLVRDIVQASEATMGSPVNGHQVIFMSPHVHQAADQFREMLFERVYRPVNELETTQQAGKVVEDLFRFFVSHPDAMQSSDYGVASSESVERQAADVVAGMTDRYALALHSRYIEAS
jgi:dGTPase